MNLIKKIYEATRAMEGCLEKGHLKALEGLLSKRERLLKSMKNNHGQKTVPLIKEAGKIDQYLIFFLEKEREKTLLEMTTLLRLKNKLENYRRTLKLQEPFIDKGNSFRG